MFIHISHAVIPALLIGIITSDASQCGNCFYGQEKRESGSRRDSERKRCRQFSVRSVYVHVPCALCGLSTAGEKSAARVPYHHPSEASAEGFVHPLKETHNFHILHRDAHLKNVHLNILLL